MGSLLPGWDERAPGVAPKGYQEFNDDEEQLGYFAAYNKMKKELKEHGDLGRKSAPMLMRRQSMPVGRVADAFGSPASRSLDKSATFAAHGVDTSSALRAPQQLQRLSSLPSSAGDKFDVSGSPTTPSLDAYKTQTSEHKQAVQWWRNFDSAHLNEMPDVPVSKERGYIPQYRVAGQHMHYRMSEGNDDEDEVVLLEGVDISSSTSSPPVSGTGRSPFIAAQ